MAPAWGAGFAGFAAVATRPRLWGALEAIALPLLRLMAAAGAPLRGRGPLGAWTRDREFPAPQRGSFRALWARGPARRGGRARRGEPNDPERGRG